MLPKVYKPVHQGEMFVKVWEELAEGNSYVTVFALLCSNSLVIHRIGIFPEGSSHDRTSMLPLQPGNRCNA